MTYLIAEILTFMLASALVGGALGFMLASRRGTDENERMEDLERLLERSDENMARMHHQIDELQTRLAAHEGEPRAKTGSG